MPLPDSCHFEGMDLTDAVIAVTWYAVALPVAVTIALMVGAGRAVQVVARRVVK
jgi:hypothetical protein